MAAPAIRFRRLTSEIALIRQRSASGLTVNLYLVQSGDRAALIDAGFPNRSEEIVALLGELGVSPRHVERVFYTHTHIDHMGGGPALSRRLTAEHVVWHECAAIASDWRAHQSRLSDWDAWAEAIVDDPQVLDAWRVMRKNRRARPNTWRHGPSSLEPARLTRPGERLAAGPFRLEMIPVPGHDPFHVVLYDRDRHVAFTGDVVLPVATPISIPMGDDTAAYLESLERLRSIDVQIAYPGHGAPMGKFRQRVDRSVRFVTERHDEIRALLAHRGSQTIYQLARVMAKGWARDIERFPIVLASVDSSVRYLANNGELRLDENRVELKHQRDDAISRVDKRL